MRKRFLLLRCAGEQCTVVFVSRIHYDLMASAEASRYGWSWTPDREHLCPHHTGSAR